MCVCVCVCVGVCVCVCTGVGAAEGRSEVTADSLDSRLYVIELDESSGVSVWVSVGVCFDE